MRRSGFNSFVVGALVFFAMQPTSRAAETNDLPHFQEVFRLLRAHLPDVSEDDLNRAAVKGLLDEFYPRVVLVTNGPSASAETEGPVVSKTAAYDRSYGYLRVARVATGLADQIRSAFEQLDATNKLKGMVLDLRFADGQDYSAAATAADRFLAKEQLLLDWGEGTGRSTAKTDAIAVPVTVLVNHQTTGAAEALAAVLREADAAVVIGSSTAGQARVFKEFDLSNGQRLRIAIGQVKVGKGKTMTDTGVTPDIQVAVSSEAEKAYFADPFRLFGRSASATSNQVSQAGLAYRGGRRLNEAELVRMQREGLNPGDEELTSRTERTEEAPAVPLVRDPALARALDLLKGIAIVDRPR